MKKRMLKPLAAIAVISMTMFSCASSNDQMNSTAMDDTTTSETQRMAGTDEQMDQTHQTDMNSDMARTETATGSDSVRYESDVRSGGLVLTDDIAYSDMFDEIEDTKQMGVLELARTSSNLSTFIKLVEQADMASALETEGPFTVFAPTNEAFAALPEGKLEYLMKPENKAELIQTLQSHFLGADVSSVQFSSTQRIGAGDDKYIPIDVTANTTTIGGATIVKPDVKASNGVIHVVDAIITPVADTGVTR
ncbi:fasciclin domain-containing protein [Pontibacter beigongshangensis]|uniref:fasciclin domain-containing protein n=1 Tax=Pontibacter beigongshangensis TaxID=2574733 RepID=UPI001F50574B|nr:fasciclin domain-containing protein [Pontibacter beigongshangensis]